MIKEVSAPLSFITIISDLKNEFYKYISKYEFVEFEDRLVYILNIIRFVEIEGQIQALNFEDTDEVESESQNSVKVDVIPRISNCITNLATVKNQLLKNEKLTKKNTELDVYPKLNNLGIY